MRNILIILSFLAVIFLAPSFVEAQSVGDVFDQVKPPPELGQTDDGATAIGTLLQRIIQLLYVFGVIAFMFMLIWSGIQMILNAGDKEAVGNARKKITTAIIGITLLALAFPIMKVLEEIIGIKFFF